MTDAAEDYRTPVERLVLFHAGALVLLTAVVYGGQIGWMRDLAAGWALLGGGALLVAQEAPRRFAGVGRDLWPVAALAALALAGLLQPAFVAARNEGRLVFVEQAASAWLPTVARPDAALRHLALLAGCIVTAYNLRHVAARRDLRRLAIVVAATAVALGVAGGVQRLLGLSLYFGHALSPNPSFFATFLYHNHWSAFALLGMALCAGLLFHDLANLSGRALGRSHASFALVGLLALAASLPLAASRSGTVLGALLLLAVTVEAGRRMFARRARTGRRVFVAAAVVMAFVLAGAAVLALPHLDRRIRQTSSQLQAVRDGRWTAVDDRPALYRATAHMVADRALFGWGPGSYGTVFPLYRTPAIAGLHYENAHSDWLQSLAERGVVGTLLLVYFTGRLAVRTLRGPRAAFAGWLLGGCALVLLYAAVEFPFANPAVQILWWLMFFGAARYAELSFPAVPVAPPTREPR